MSDFKLLAMAVKAAGLHVKGHRVDADDNFTHLIVGAKGTREKTNWNPLTDDGDALRLAVKLNLLHGKVFARGVTNHHRDGGDIYAATRRAIVLAAAEIGRELL